MVMDDYVFLWNSLALELNQRDHTGKMNATNQKGPTQSSRALAIAHIAMHDAHFGRTGLPPLVSTLQGLSGPINTYLNVTSLSPPRRNPWKRRRRGFGCSSYSVKLLIPRFFL